MSGLPSRRDRNARARRSCPARRIEREIRGTPDRERGPHEVGHAKPHKKKERSSFLEEFLDFG